MRRFRFFGQLIMGILALLGVASLSGCGENSIFGPVEELTVSVRNITPYRSDAEGLCRGRTEYVTLREDEGARFDCPWYNDNSRSNAVLTAYIDAPWGRIVRTQQWPVDRRAWSVSCSIVTVQKYLIFEAIELQCTN